MSMQKVHFRTRGDLIEAPRMKNPFIIFIKAYDSIHQLPNTHVGYSMLSETTACPARCLSRVHVTNGNTSSFTTQELEKSGSHQRSIACAIYRDRVEQMRASPPPVAVPRRQSFQGRGSGGDSPAMQLSSSLWCLTSRVLHHGEEWGGKRAPERLT